MNSHNYKMALFAGPLSALCLLQGAAADDLHADDVIIQGSACVGQDCVLNQDFDFDVLRFQENNLRIHYEDTSSTSAFPGNDWRLLINDSGNGGANYFAIEDATRGSVPMRIDAGSPGNSLYVGADGNIGFGTSTPLEDAHLTDGDTPTLRLDQDGTGFPAQTWDVAGNEANFFVRDVSNGSRLPFRIRPAAPTNTLYLQADGDVGIGVSDSPASAEASLHIRRTGSSPPSIILETTNPNPAVKWQVKANEDTGRLTVKELNSNTTPLKFGPDAAENLLRVGIVDPGAVSVRGDLVLESVNAGAQWEVKVNQTTGRMTMSDRNGTTTPFKLAPNAAENLLRVGVAASDTVSIGGDLVISGNCSESDGACADYVFDNDYALRPLDDLSRFIADNRHLPNVPSAEQIEEEGVNMARFSGRLLEKIEELTLYTLQQQQTIDDLTARLTQLEQQATNSGSER